MKIKFKLYLLIPIAFLWPIINPAFSSEPTLTVWKSANCGCCQKWVEYMENNGFKVVSNNVENVGLVNFGTGLNGNSGWHGSFLVHNQSLLINFNCRGGDRPLRATILTSPNGGLDYTGWDYQGRWITMRSLAPGARRLPIAASAA